MTRMFSFFLLLIPITTMGIVSYARPQAWMYEEENLRSVVLPDASNPLPIISSLDVNQDLKPEYLSIKTGQVMICRTVNCLDNSNGESDILWNSPPSWQIDQAAFTDLNHDHQPEITLLVWRAFKSWPIDQFLPHPGRIESFHDARGQSCHLILIGWNKGMFKEKWAGSALVNPLRSFLAADLNRDGYQELIVLESKYNESFTEPAWGLSVWEWNGFGFSRLSGIKGRFHNISIYEGTQQHLYIVDQ